RAQAFLGEQEVRRGSIGVVSRISGRMALEARSSRAGKELPSHRRFRRSQSLYLLRDELLRLVRNGLEKRDQGAYLVVREGECRHPYLQVAAYAVAIGAFPAQ